MTQELGLAGSPVFPGPIFRDCYHTVEAAYRPLMLQNLMCSQGPALLHLLAASGSKLDQFQCSRPPTQVGATWEEGTPTLPPVSKPPRTLGFPGS